MIYFCDAGVDINTFDTCVVRWSFGQYSARRMRFCRLPYPAVGVHNMIPSKNMSLATDHDKHARFLRTLKP